MKATDRSRATAFGSIPADLRDESGAFPIGERHWEPADAQAIEALEELAPEKVSLIPEPPPESLRPRARSLPAPTGERAQLVIEDLTLRPDNPYLASSLVPPPEKPGARKRKIALIAAGMLSAAAVGALVELVVLRAHVSQSAVEAPRVAAAVAAPAKPAAVAQVAPVEVAAPVVVPVVPAAPVVSEPVAPAPSPVPVVAVEAPVLKKVEAPVAKPAAAAQAKTAPAELPTPPEPAVAVAAEPVATPAAVPAAEAAAPVSAPATSVEPAAAVPAASADPAAPAAELPATLTREQVAAGFDALKPALEQCAQGGHGVVQIDAAIAGSGRVAHALIGGAFVGTPEGSCMARAVRSARFPASAQERMSVRYPIAL